VPSPPDPVADWTFAADPEALHAVWQDRFALSAQAERLPETTLLPYADALELNGASWGLRPSEIRFVYETDSGVFSVFGTEHPQEQSAPRPARAEDLTAWGRTADDSPAHLRISFRGTSLSIQGPLVVRTSCLDCHEMEEGSVAGVFFYELDEIADD
jgi:hypothetical protein